MTDISPPPDPERSDAAPVLEPGPTPAGRVTRRWILGSTALLVATAAGVAAGLRQPFGGSNPFDRHVSLPAPPPSLVSAAAREAQLVASLSAARTASPSDSRLAQLLADHRAHASALAGVLAQYSPAEPTPSAEPAVTGTDDAALRAQEEAAQLAAAQESAVLDGESAALLASISACEASHVEILGAANV
ncbi:hypothetical protein SAMN05892883_3353 [Jatrophihabitans sp. GAS493]|uniref:hypothetical protein n=1 Tax=Jatrophihabitans sp. GAS493 TaxID=1907575 RepID=UPI000BB6815E|nr:hypothetical protein [Jatrophihabitans sp. GAS493]SOD74172.1 hypothetical protein SAMN05892883_3353 [Jatrophihabitans sp. GAS493]